MQSPSAPYDAVVVGGGPAGLSGALVLARCRRRVLVVDSGRYRNERSQALHCYLGHDGIAPADLLALARRQLEAYDDITRISATATRIRREGDAFVATLADGREVASRTILAATGVVDELPRVPGIDAFWGRTVHVCPYCDGWEHRNAPVAVYGRSSKGAGLALLLRQWTGDLVLVTDGPARLTEDEQRKLQQRQIDVIEDPVTGLEGSNGQLERICFSGHSIARRALFFNTGQHPRSRLLEEIGCRFAENGGVACDANGLTSVSGLYVAGDISRDVQLASIAVAEGARAALALNKHLLRLDDLL